MAGEKDTKIKRMKLKQKLYSIIHLRVSNMFVKENLFREIDNMEEFNGIE